MPKREFLFFDGDPKKYPRFIKSFKTNGERRAKEDDERLSFLIQYCERAAKEAIKNCTKCYPSNMQGHRKVKEILRKNF